MESSKPDEQEIKAQAEAAVDTTAESKKAPAEKKDSKADRDAKKQARLAERQTKTQVQKEAEFKKDPNDPCADKFGDLELNRSQSDPELRYAKKYIQVHELNESLAGQEVFLRGRLHSSRPQGKKLVFIVIREQFATV